MNKNAAADFEDGRSWDTAYKTVQEGIDAAVGTADAEVWVAAASYDEQRGNGGAVLLRPDIDVYGRVFSYGVIALVNLGGVCLWIVAVSSATMGDLGLTLQEEALSMWEGIRGLAENWRKSG